MDSTLAQATIVSILKTGTSNWNGREWRIGLDANGQTVLQRLSQVYGWVNVARGSDEAIMHRFAQITS